MKLKIFGLLIATSALSFSVYASPYQFTAGDNSEETKLCVAAAENNLRQLKTKVGYLFPQRSVYSQGYTVVANQLKCNDTNIVKFARQYDANKTARFLAQFLEGNVNVRRTDISANLPSYNDVSSRVVVTAN